MLSSPFVSKPTAHPPIPRQPIGATFVVAISLLGALAIVELLAAAWHYIPLMRQQVARTAEPQATSQEVASTPAPQTQQPPAPSPEIQKAQKLLADADRSSRVGDFEAALKTLEELGKLLPGDPSVLLRKALVLERLHQSAGAVAVLGEILRYPGLPPEIRTQAQTKLDGLVQALASGRKYFGYIVGVYYNNELQDFRADPASLAKDFPLQLYLKEGGG